MIRGNVPKLATSTYWLLVSKKRSTETWYSAASAAIFVYILSPGARYLSGSFSASFAPTFCACAARLVSLPKPPVGCVPCEQNTNK